MIGWSPERKIVSEAHIQMGGEGQEGRRGVGGGGGGYVVLSYVWAIYYGKLC